MRRHLGAVLLVGALTTIGCGGQAATGSVSTPPAHHRAAAFDAGLMGKVEREVKAKARAALARRGYGLLSMDTDCVPDSARRFTCLSSTDAKDRKTGLCYTVRSVQRGTVAADGSHAWKSSEQGGELTGCDR
jgi:hypothetical protein